MDKTASCRAMIEQVIRSDEKRLVNYLTAVLRDGEAAQDIAQSAFLRTLEYAKTCVIDNPSGFVFKTASNMAKNEIRRRIRFDRLYLTTAHYSRDEVKQDLESSAPTPEDYASLREDVAIIIDAISALPENVRRAFVMNRFEGRTYKEIAKVMSVSESSVEKYIMEALTRLRRSLADDAS